MTWKPPPVPREYGAWAMFVLPLVLGAVAARAVTASSLLVLPAAVLLFLARFSAIPGGTRLRSAVRRAVDPRRAGWTVVYLAASALGLVLAVALVEPSQRPAAVGLALVAGLLGTTNAALVLAGRGRAAFVEILAMAAASTMAPLVMVLAGAPAGGRALGVGAICFAYSLSTLAFVRAFRPLREERTRGIAAAACLAAHAVLVAALVTIWRVGWLPFGLLLAFAPVLARTLWGLLRPAPNLRVLGWRELGVAVVFLGAAVLAVL